MIFAGGKTWRPNQGYYVLTTTDGLTFTNNHGYLGTGGGCRSITRKEGDEYAFVTLYPGSSNGIDSRFIRFYRPAGTDQDFQQDTGLFTVGVDDQATIAQYRTLFMSDVDGNDNLDYVVAYSTPSWNTIALGLEDYSPGFLAVHDFDGPIISTYTINALEDQELFTDLDPPTSSFYGALGSVSVYVPQGASAGSAEILWYSGIYGYGRYAIGDAPVSVDSWEIY